MVDFYGTWGSPTSGWAEGSAIDQDYNSTKSPLVTNHIDNIPGKKGLMSTEDGTQGAEVGAAARFSGCVY